MNGRSHINLSESSIVDLQAELFRKEQEFRTLQRPDYPEEATVLLNRGEKTFDKIRSIARKHPKSCSMHSSAGPAHEPHGKALTEEEVRRLQMSRSCLEKKAELYEKLSLGIIQDDIQDDGETRFLVNFPQKTPLPNPSFTGQDRPDHQGKQDELQTENWVEFLDTFGRQRRCSWADYTEIQRDGLVATILAYFHSDPAVSIRMADEMQRASLHRKWEREQCELEEKGQESTHYQNILFDEIRPHGVGYYNFSQDEVERQKQMELLEKLRQQTIEARRVQENIKQARQTALQARLSKVRERKQVGTHVDLSVSHPHPHPHPHHHDHQKEATADSSSSLSSSVSGVASVDCPEPVPNLHQLEGSAQRDGGNPFMTSMIDNMLAEVRLETQKESVSRRPPKRKAPTWEEVKRKLEDERNPDFAPPLPLQS